MLENLPWREEGQMDRRAPIERRIAVRVRELRTAKGLTQADLARLARTSRSQVALVEGGESVPSVATVETFAEALGCSLGEVLSEHPEPRERQSTPGRASRLVATLQARGPEYIAAVERMVRVMDKIADAARRGSRRPRRSRT
jgi:transcriptional regulator with XRE-family HTH domain